jgi:septal ring factor EnvC (AmiA/AmiB activator)
MASAAERISVVETKVEGLTEKIDDLKTSVKEINTNMTEHNEQLQAQLKTMYDASCEQHAELAKKIGAIEQFKNKWIYLIVGGSIVGGWLISHIDLIIKIYENIRATS